MKKYNLYGIGAAIVDTEVIVSDEEECPAIKL